MTKVIVDNELKDKVMSLSDNEKLFKDIRSLS